MLTLLWSIPQVRAEPYAAIYGGFSLLSNTTFRTDVSLAGDPRLNDDLIVESTIDTIRGLHFSTEVDNSPIFGGKAGYWFDFFPLVGVELEIYTFKPNITVPPQTRVGTVLGDDGEEEDASITFTEPFKFDVTVVAIGFNLLGRYPLFKSPRYPRGRLQPYIGGGPGLFVTTIEDKEEDAADNIGKKTLAFGGFQAVGGLKWFLLNKLALFAEYKFTFFTADLSGASEAFSLGARQDIVANHFYGGIAYHFY
jgi:hypothetical protein